MSKANTAICGFLAFETAGLAMLFFVASTGAEEFVHFDPEGWWPLFVALKSLSASMLLTGGSLAVGWGIAGFKSRIAAQRGAAFVDVA